MTKIKGAIEVYIDAVGQCVSNNYLAMFASNGVALTFADLEAYVTERERKAFEASRKGMIFYKKKTLWGQCKTFEDFKKLNKNASEDSHE